MSMKRAPVVAIIIFATLVGAFVAYAGGRWLVVYNALRNESAIAAHQAKRIFANHDESLRVLKRAEAVEGGFCSAADLRRLRRLVFEAEMIKDIGRLRDRRLVCTTALGRISEDVDVGPPTFTSRRRVHWYVNDELLVSNKERALILQTKTTNIVVNTALFLDIEHPHVMQAVMAIHPATGKVFTAVGERPPVPGHVLKAALARGQGRFDNAGHIGVVTCHADGAICMAVSQKKAALFNEQGLLLALLAFLGASTGAGSALALSAVSARRRSLGKRLRNAIRRGELDVEYQPQVDFQRGRTVGAEALVRWVEKDGTRHRPDQFVEVAEAEGFISALTRLVVERTIDELSEILRGDLDFVVSVNFAAADLADAGMLDLVSDRLRAAGIAPAQFTFELTERAAGDSDAVRQTLAAIRARGHHVAIDDFGVGYSSLSYLQTMPVDYLKIDKSFTDTIGTGAVTASIVPQIVDMARTVNLGIVVEGVETADQVAYLRGLHVSVVQGWYYARPMPAAALRAWLVEPLPLDDTETTSETAPVRAVDASTKPGAKAHEQPPDGRSTDLAGDLKRRVEAKS